MKRKGLPESDACRKKRKAETTDLFAGLPDEAIFSFFARALEPEEIGMPSRVMF